MGITEMLPVGSDERGFTLLELILVLLLLGLSSLVVLPRIDKGLREREVRQSALALAAVARDLRGRALYEGVPQRLTLDLSQNSYRVAGRQEVQLPSDVTFSAVEGGETLEGGARQFLFFPNGSTFGGEIGLSAVQNSSFYSVRMEALTGKIVVSRRDQS